VVASSSFVEEPNLGGQSTWPVVGSLSGYCLIALTACGQLRRLDCRMMAQRRGCRR
jgi:hypothetical protein